MRLSLMVEEEETEVVEVIAKEARHRPWDQSLSMRIDLIVFLYIITQLIPSWDCYCRSQPARAPPAHAATAMKGA